MTQEENIDEWVRKHKKLFARKLIRDAGVERSGEPTAIFMAGLPGAGKTEFAKNLIKNLGVKVIRLDMDEIAAQIESYSPQKADKFRVGASALLNRTFDKVVIGGYDFVMDGTFGGTSAVRNIDRVVKHGYAVKVIYVYQNPAVAWQYTLAREKIEHRAINMQGFVDSYFRTIGNLHGLKEHGEAVKVDIVVKNDSNSVKEWRRNISVKDIDHIVKFEYNEKELKEKLYVSFQNNVDEKKTDHK